MRVSTNQSGSDLLLQFPQALLGPLFWGMFRARTQEEREWRYPTGPSGVSIGGIDPARILVIGDGPAAGCGVRTHQLGIAGHLARYVAARSERGVVVTVAAHPAASARSTLERLDGMDLDGYDSIVLILAATDAFCLTARRSWRRDMTGLVHALKAADRASVFVTSTASLDLARSLSRFARCLMGTHARMLDIETSRICAQSNTPMIHLDAVSELSSRTYSRWGRRIGAHVARSLQDVDPAADNENTATAFRP
ncbi:MAG: hypothetical protein ABWX82_02320 [Leifsonia sp.]